MKIKSLILAMAVCFGFTACSSDDDNTPNNGAGEGDAYASFSFVMPNASTGANSKAPNTENGTEAESDMTAVTLLFFNPDNGTLAVKKDFVKSDFTAAGKINGTDVTYTKKTSFMIAKGTYLVYAFVNPATEIKALVEKTGNISDIQGAAALSDVDLTQSIAKDNSFAMTNSLTVESTTVDGTAASPTVITIKVERSVAKVVDNTKFDAFTTTGGSKPGSSVYFQGMTLVNQNKEYFYLRRTGDEAGTNLVYGGAETGTNYVIDPNFTTTAATDFFNPISTNVTFTDLKQTIYCAENTVTKAASKKDNITTIIYKAKFVPKGVTTESDGTFYVFGGNYYGTTEEIKTAAGIAENVTDWTVANWKAQGVDFYKGGICYYNAYLRHNIPATATTTSADVMEYAVVRNNVYQAAVNSVKDLGTTEPGEGPDPKADDTYVTVIVEVMPWTVRVNAFDL